MSMKQKMPTDLVDLLKNGNPHARITVGWGEIGDCGGDGFLKGLKDRAHQAASAAGISVLSTSESCTYEYYGCGSCGGDDAYVLAYCGSGGSEPDYWWCESCW